jgi:hypothetical protein
MSVLCVAPCIVLVWVPPGLLATGSGCWVVWGLCSLNTTFFIDLVYNIVFFSSVTRWCKKFESGVDLEIDAPNTRRPKTASAKMVEKVKDLIATDVVIYARCVGTSVGAAHTILRRDLKREE